MTIENQTIIFGAKDVGDNNARMPTYDLEHL